MHWVWILTYSDLVILIHSSVVEEILAPAQMYCALNNMLFARFLKSFI